MPLDAVPLSYGQQDEAAECCCEMFWKWTAGLIEQSCWVIQRSGGQRPPGPLWSKMNNSLLFPVASIRFKKFQCDCDYLEACSRG